MTTSTRTKPNAARRAKRAPSTSLFCGFHHRSEAERDQLKRVTLLLRRSKADVCRMAVKAYCDSLTGGA